MGDERSLKAIRVKHARSESEDEESWKQTRRFDLIIGGHLHARRGLFSIDGKGNVILSLSITSLFMHRKGGLGSSLAHGDLLWMFTSLGEQDVHSHPLCFCQILTLKGSATGYPYC